MPASPRRPAPSPPIYVFLGGISAGSGPRIFGLGQCRVVSRTAVHDTSASAHFARICAADALSEGAGNPHLAGSAAPPSFQRALQRPDHRRHPAATTTADATTAHRPLLNAHCPLHTAHCHPGHRATSEPTPHRHHHHRLCILLAVNPPRPGHEHAAGGSDASPRGRRSMKRRRRRKLREFAQLTRSAKARRPRPRSSHAVYKQHGFG